MTFKTARLHLLLLTLVAAGRVHGKIDNDLNQTPLCAALLVSSELSRAPRHAPAADLAEATRGARSAVVLMKWRSTRDVDVLDDPRLQVPLVYRDGVTFAVQPRRDGAAGIFAVMVGSRRGLLNEARRLEAEYGIGPITFQVLKRKLARLDVPSTVTAPADEVDLRLTHVIYDTVAKPDVAFYDVKTGGIFYPVSLQVLDALDEDELRAYGVVSARTPNFRGWHRHPHRAKEPNSLIRLKTFAMLSHGAFHILRDLIARAGRLDPAPSSFELEAALNECLNAACDPPAPAPVPSVGGPPAAHLPDTSRLPTLANLRTEISRVPPLTNSIVRKLIALGHGTEVDLRRVLDRDNSLARIFDCLWGHYFPNERPTHVMLKRDGDKLLRPGEPAEQPGARLLKAWTEFKVRVRAG